ncbi:hypothetical protein EB234_06890 [Mesorhizobium japonicum R7A]|uniref:Uncharacterized protein n=1 Tax=Mesorhizobium japonicum TaxID=2066070 RepID=A0A3M9X667_9HYPH|nr:hypothetical protein EB234_06890 [Mesorhizobium japonicum R7A]RNJ43331.1 hypothetical protein DNR46_21845 [Mesorhizobium japonicum]
MPSTRQSGKGFSVKLRSRRLDRPRGEPRRGSSDSRRSELFVAATPQSGTEASGAAQLQSIEAGTRPVRVVGPAFFPAE